jgi:hypothetical protein
VASKFSTHLKQSYNVYKFININDQWGLSSLGWSTKDLPNAPPKSPNKLEITSGVIKHGLLAMSPVNT